MVKKLKVLHISDLHLGKKLQNFSRMEEQEDVCREICRIAEDQNVDAVVAAGDLYDTFNPPSNAVSLLYRTLKTLSRGGQVPIIAIAGNHDSPERIQSPDILAKLSGIFFAGHPDSEEQDFETEAGVKFSFKDAGALIISFPDDRPDLSIIYTPYANEHRLKKALNTPEGSQLNTFLGSYWKKCSDAVYTSDNCNIFCAHIFAAGTVSTSSDLKKSPEGTQELPFYEGNFCDSEGAEITENEDERSILHPGGLAAINPALIPGDCQYAALGHIHRYARVSKNPPAVYSGSPLAYSVSEAGQKKYCVIAQLEPGGEPAEIKRIELESGIPVHRIYCEEYAKLEDQLEGISEDYIELTLRCEDFITSAQRKEIATMCPRLLTLIPDVQNKAAVSSNSSRIGKSVDELFEEYYFSKTGEKPGDKVAELFKRIKGEV